MTIMECTKIESVECDTACPCPYVETIAEMRNDIAWIKRLVIALIVIAVGNGVFLVRGLP